MGEERRCKKCKKTIDEGELCSMCQFKHFNKTDMRDTLKKKVDLSSKYKAMADNEATQPPMPWNKD